MLTWLIIAALLLLSAAMSAVFLINICAIWHASLGRPSVVDSKGIGNGLSALDLERLPGVEAGETLKGAECAVCLDEIKEGQIVRVMPECRHVFHRGCVDSWLSVNALCPMCRNPLLPPPLLSERMQQGGDDTV